MSAAVPTAKRTRGATHSGHDQPLVNPGANDASLTVADHLESSMTRDCLVKLSSLGFSDDKGKAVECEEQKKAPSRIIGRGLRQFSVLVHKKIEAKGITTYNEVADEIIAEFCRDGDNGSCSQYDEKNIRRRVYDAFNVLLAIGVIARDKKEVRWVGFPDAKRDLKEIEEKRTNLLNRIQQKIEYLQDLEERFIGMKSLMLRNEQLHKSDNVTTDGIMLPFILVQAPRDATVEIEISDDRKLVQFDFNGTPFQLHDEGYVLKEMGIHQAGSPSHDARKSPADLRGRNGREPHSSGFSWSPGPNAEA